SSRSRRGSRWPRSCRRTRCASMPCGRSRRLSTLARPHNLPAIQTLRSLRVPSRTVKGVPVYPEDLKYTAEHEWVRADGGPEGSVRIGITDYAQDALGDVVFVTLPQVGDEVTAGQSCGEIESTKSVSDLYAPVTGTVTATNDALDGTP